MKKRPVIQLLSGEAPADTETAKRFYKWIVEKHVPDLFKYKGMKRAANYRFVPETDDRFATSTEYPAHISIFEFYSQKDKEEFMNSPEIAAAIEDGLAMWGPDVGYKKMWNAAYEEMESWER